MTEIFRHLRPHWFDKKMHSLIPYVNGGISFLLQPIGDKIYHFWIYSVPLDIPFSSRQAVKTLREVSGRNVVPFGILTMTKDPVLDQLISFLIKEESVLPSEASKIALEILIANTRANSKMEYASKINSIFPTTLKEFYEND